MIVKFINPTAVGNVSMSTKTTPIKDGIKSTSRSQGDAPAQSNGGASAGLGGQAPQVEDEVIQRIRDEIDDCGDYCVDYAYEVDDDDAYGLPTPR